MDEPDGTGGLWLLSELMNRYPEQDYSNQIRKYCQPNIAGNFDRVLDVETLCAFGVGWTLEAVKFSRKKYQLMLEDDYLPVDDRLLVPHDAMGRFDDLLRAAKSERLEPARLQEFGEWAKSRGFELVAGFPVVVERVSGRAFNKEGAKRLIVKNISMKSAGAKDRQDFVVRAVEFLANEYKFDLAADLPDGVRSAVIKAGGRFGHYLTKNNMPDAWRAVCKKKGWRGMTRNKQ